MNDRKCSHCNKTKNLFTGFHKCSSSSLGYNTVCKDCKNEMNRESRAKLKEMYGNNLKPIVRNEEFLRLERLFLFGKNFRKMTLPEMKIIK